MNPHEIASSRAGRVDLAEVAEDWLAAKRVGRRSDDPGHADRARRADLCRWAAAINEVAGRTEPVPPQSLGGWTIVGSDLSDVQVLVRALDLLGSELASRSRVRMLSTLRGFCGYAVRRGVLNSDPTDVPELTVRSTSYGEVRGFTPSDAEALITAAGTAPGPRDRSRWPARDVALVAVLARCGLRVSEACALPVNAVDRAGEHAILRVRAGAKGGRHRDVPVPASTVTSFQAYLNEREQLVGTTGLVFIRRDGSGLNQQFVDALLRKLCQLQGVTPPAGAMAHALRHSYGADLAYRGVPLPIIQQLLGHADPRTTSIYTAVHMNELAHALREAGVL